MIMEWTPVLMESLSMTRRCEGFIAQLKELLDSAILQQKAIYIFNNIIVNAG